MDPALRVSDLVKTHFCPVRFSLEKDDPVQERGRYIVCKQLSYHLGGCVDTEQVWEEILGIAPDVDPVTKTFLQECVDTCAKSTGWKMPVQTDVPVRSERYGILGRVDKLFDSPVSFSIVRCGTAPALGVYPADRLRIAAYALCLKETLGRELEGGCVEYIPSGIVRYCRPQPRDRRALMAALRSARRILEGEIPHKPVDASRCPRCPHEERCASGSRASRLSDRF
jgi:CRISPR-associated exonuclease Cas4